MTDSRVFGPAREAAARATLTARQRVLTALAHRAPDKVPKEAYFTPPMLELFRRETGAAMPDAFFLMDTRQVAIRPTQQAIDWSPYLPGLPANARIKDFGLARVPGTMHHYGRLLFPLAGVNSPSELKAFPWPDLRSDYRHGRLDEEIAAHHAQGLFVLAEVEGVWETAWAMRNMERLMADMAEQPAYASFLLERVNDDLCWLAARYAAAGADMVMLGDDVGMQERLMMSPTMWRRWLKPLLAAQVEAARQANPAVHVFYHSDGWIEPLIPELIELGIDVLNPVQPECMDPVKLKREYGEDLSFWGTIGIQTTMPHGTPAEVAAEVSLRVQTVGKNGGLVLAPTHVLQPDVPWANVEAFFAATDTVGWYD